MKPIYVEPFMVRERMFLEVDPRIKAAIKPGDALRLELTVNGDIVYVRENGVAHRRSASASKKTTIRAGRKPTYGR